ncbi:MAG TPA: hypothetical protein VGU02_01430 [Gaiellaceae bacterium]|nr:hypothetical protein [Gaiellaceae bacterium]
MKRLTPIIALLAVAGVLAGVASAAAPANTTKPTISGTEKAGSTLTASNGTWSNSPTTYTYQWRRCATDGTACGDITGAASKTYTLTTNDVHHTMRVVVTAKNTDGSASATSDPSGVIGSASGPSNTVKPAVSGSTVPGSELTVSNGSWSPAATSYLYQWQRCDTAGANCLNVAGATGKTYGVRTADAGSKMRALVTARNSKGQTTVASSTSDLIGSGTTTTTVTTTVAGNKAPTLSFLSLRRVGKRVYARFRVCDDKLGKITVTERDNKARALSYTRHFTLYRSSSCATFSRSWIPAARFRTKGRYVVTLRAADTSGASSPLRSRSLYKR